MTTRVTLTIDEEILLDAMETYPTSHPMWERLFNALSEIAKGQLRQHTGARLQLCGIAIENTEVMK